VPAVAAAVLDMRVVLCMPQSLVGIGFAEPAGMWAQAVDTSWEPRPKPALQASDSLARRVPGHPLAPSALVDLLHTPALFLCPNRCCHLCLLQLKKQPLLLRHGLPHSPRRGCSKAAYQETSY
jgi:hypothetical protein